MSWHAEVILETPRNRRPARAGVEASSTPNTSPRPLGRAAAGRVGGTGRETLILHGRYVVSDRKGKWTPAGTRNTRGVRRHWAVAGAAVLGLGAVAGQARADEPTTQQLMD